MVSAVPAGEVAAVVAVWVSPYGGQCVGGGETVSLHYCPDTWDVAPQVQKMNNLSFSDPQFPSSSVHLALENWL